MCWSCCGDVCVCVRERKLSRTEGVCSLARYHVNVLCFLSTWFCKTREPLSARLKPGHGGRAQWCSLPGVHSYRRYCWPRLSGARLWGAPLWKWCDRSETVRNAATCDFIIHFNLDFQALQPRIKDASPADPKRRWFWVWWISHWAKKGFQVEENWKGIISIQSTEGKSALISRQRGFCFTTNIADVLFDADAIWLILMNIRAVVNVGTCG